MALYLHEPYCLDNLKSQLLWIDHFLAGQLRDEWTSAGGAGGSAVVVDQEDGGICRITTDNNNNDSWTLDWGDIRSLLISKRISMEFRLKIPTITTIEVAMGLFFDWTHLAYFKHDTPLGTYHMRTEDGIGAQFVDSGIAVDTNYRVFRIVAEVSPSTLLRWYIDGVECGNSPISLNLPTEHLQPFIHVKTEVNATRSIDLDYVGVRQDI